MSVSMKQLKQALKEVAAEKPKPTSSKSKKRNAKRRQRKREVSLAVPGTSGGVVMSTMRSATMTMQHREYLGQFTVAASATTAQGSLILSPLTPAWLAGISKSFEKYQWVSLALEYVPDVGTTKDGSVAWGIDWGVTNVSSVSEHSLTGVPGFQLEGTYTRSDIVALTPSAVMPLWRPNKIVVPSSVLQSRKWYDVGTTATFSSDYAPGALAYFVTAAAGTVGDVWISYKVVFAGTRKP